MFNEDKFRELVLEQTKKFNDYLDGKKGELSKKAQEIVNVIRTSPHRRILAEICGILLDEELVPHIETSLLLPILACIKLKDNPNGHNYALDKVYMVVGNRRAIKDKLFGNNLPNIKLSYEKVTDEEVEEFLDKLNIGFVVSKIIRDGDYTGFSKLIEE